MIKLDHEQGTDEWFAARRGLPTASGFKRIVTSKGEASKQKEVYLYQLAGERLSGTVDTGYKNGAMLMGNELEPEARESYEFIRGVTVEQVGLCVVDSGRYGASPDGLVGDDGLVEIKCVEKMGKLIGFRVKGNSTIEHYQQIQGQLLVTGREWCDLFIYHPHLPPIITRVERDNVFLDKLIEQLDSFCDELDALVERLEE